MNKKTLKIGYLRILDGDQIPTTKNEVETIFNVQKCLCEGTLFAWT